MGSFKPPSNENVQATTLNTFEYEIVGFTLNNSTTDSHTTTEQESATEARQDTTHSQEQTSIQMRQGTA